MCVLGKISLCSDKSRYLGSFGSLSPPHPSIICSPSWLSGTGNASGWWYQERTMKSLCSSQVCLCAGGQYDPQHQVSHSAPPPPTPLSHTPTYKKCLCFCLLGNRQVVSGIVKIRDLKVYNSLNIPISEHVRKDKHVVPLPELVFKAFVLIIVQKSLYFIFSDEISWAQCL